MLSINPIINRFSRSRLRPRALIFWLLATLITVSFTFFITFLVARRQLDMEMVDAARKTLIPLMVIQGIILMLLGTGAVASGITQEKLDGVIDYQRMTPIHPRSKIFGYLFGLPLREYLMFAITLPFLMFAIIAGKVPLSAWLPFYMLFASSVLLYHMTGFTAAMISKRWRWSARIAQGLVIVLYFFLPQLSHLGIVFFEYLTVRPAINQYVFPLMNNSVEFADGLGAKKVPLFHWQLNSTVFSLLIQGCLLVLFYRMIERKWNQEAAPSLGKIGGSIAFAGALILALGNMWPSITGSPLDDSPYNLELSMMMVVSLPLAYGFLAMLVGLWVLKVISPERACFQRGQMRRKKFGWHRLPFTDDNATARPFVLAYALLSGSILLGIYFTMRKAGYYDDLPAQTWSPWKLSLTVSLTLLYFHSTREFLGGKNQMLLGLLVWIAPILLAIVITSASQDLPLLAYYALAISPWGLMIISGFYPAAALTDSDLHNMDSLLHAFIFGFLLIGGLTVYFQFKLWRWQLSIADK
jgi:hypothetical protein